MTAERKFGWQQISRTIGLCMIIILFILYLIAAFDPDVHPDRYVSLTFLVIAAALVGIPSGYRLIVSRNGSTGA